MRVAVAVLLLFGLLSGVAQAQALPTTFGAGPAYGANPAYAPNFGFQYSSPYLSPYPYGHYVPPIDTRRYFSYDDHFRFGGYDICTGGVGRASQPGFPPYLAYPPGGCQPLGR